jgi:DNA-binding winged helix-turn-helix (wHTH) protein
MECRQLGKIGSRSRVDPIFRRGSEWRARKREMRSPPSCWRRRRQHLARPPPPSAERAAAWSRTAREGSAEPAASVARIGALVVDTAGRRVTVNEREVPLRAKKFDLLARLAAEPGVAISRATLMSDVWDEHWFGSTKTLDVHVAALRRRLAEFVASGAIPQIVTLRGHGYRRRRAQQHCRAHRANSLRASGPSPLTPRPSCAHSSPAAGSHRRDHGEDAVAEPPHAGPGRSGRP